MVFLFLEEVSNLLLDVSRESKFWISNLMDILIQ